MKTVLILLGILLLTFEVSGCGNTQPQSPTPYLYPQAPAVTLSPVRTLPPPSFRNIRVRSATPQQISVGITCSIDVDFEYCGPQSLVEIYAAIGKTRAFGFAEDASQTLSFTTPEAVDWTTVTAAVPVRTTGALDKAWNPYSAYAKILRINLISEEKKGFIWMN